MTAVHGLALAIAGLFCFVAGRIVLTQTNGEDHEQL